MKLAVPFIALALMGLGCGSGGSGSKAADGGIWKTTDAGVKFASANVLSGGKSIGSLATASVMNIEMDPHDSQILYASTREHGLLVSEDGASTWQQPRQAALRTGSVVDVEADPKELCTVYIATPKRLMKSDTCLRTLYEQVYVENRPTASITDVEVDWYNASAVWLGMGNGDIFKSEDAGKTWRKIITLKGAVTQMMVSNADSRQVLVGTDKDGLWKTVDAGVSWVQIEKELKDFRNGNKVWSLVQDKTSATVVAATQYGLLRSQDFGSTWEGIALLTAPGQITIKALAMDPENVSSIAFASLGTLYSTTDGGVTWKTVKLPTARIPEVLIADPLRWETMYLGVSAPLK